MTPAPVLLRRTLGPILLGAVVAGIIAASVSRRQAPGVDATLTFTVPAPARTASVSSEQETAFESLQAAELFAETLTGWLASPDFVSAVYQRASVAFAQPSVRRFSRAFVAKKRGGQVVDVGFRAQSSEEASALARAIAAEVTERTNALNTEKSPWRFEALAGTPLIVPVRVLPAVRGLVAAVVVLVVGINLVLLWDFLQSGSHNGLAPRA